jgi:hypothetical protein
MGYTAEYNRQHAGKAWEIRGWTHDGAVLCADCGDAAIPDETTAEQQFYHPIFSTDELDELCSDCGVQVLA